LRVGDSIQATVTHTGAGKARIDTSPWSNIESAIIKVGSNTSIAPGTKIYDTVTDISEEAAILTQKRGAYKRQHLPGDSLRMQTVEQVSSSVCQAALDQFRNLNTVYTVGVSVGADVTATLAKIRDGTAFALPVTIHDQGLVAGRSIQLSTTGGSTRATIADESTLSVLDQHGGTKFQVELTEPAWTTGPATAEITVADTDPPKATVVEYPTELPRSGDRLTTNVTKGEDHTKIRLNRADAEFTVALSHNTPANGKATIDLLDRADGFYKGKIVEYVAPPIQVGQTHEGRVYAPRNKAKIEFSGRHVTVIISDDIPTTGEGSVKITEISDNIYGQLVGDIDPTTDDKERKSGVDMTDVSKF
ncbi:MAG: hypothetical protein J07HQW1_01852, partial [Haloquadratum walsbyi J07HQW1]